MKEKKMIPISRDGNRIARMCADLETFCELMNDLIAKFKDHGIFAKDMEVTDEIVKDLAMLHTDSIKANLKAAYELEAAGIAIPVKRQEFLDSLLEAYQIIDKLIDETREIIDRKGVKLYLSGYDDLCRYISDERVKYISVKKGKVVYDRKMIEDDNTIYASGDYFQDFIKRAKALHQQMVDFDREVRILSAAKGSIIYGIGDVDAYNDSLITTSDGMIYLDWNQLRHIEFENADEALKNGITINNSKIMGESIIKEIESSINKKG